MKLSELVYESVRDSIILPNASLSKHELIKNLTSGTSVGKDWELQTAGIFNALNTGLSILSDNNKIPYDIDEVELVGNIGEFKKGDIMNVVRVYTNGKYHSLAFRTFGIHKFAVLSDKTYKSVSVEYKPYIPHFSADSLVPITQDDAVDKNIDLFEEYGITDKMCDYLKEFIKGEILEIASPELSIMHKNEAKTLLSNLRTSNTSFFKDRVANKQAGWLL